MRYSRNQMLFSRRRLIKSVGIIAALSAFRHSSLVHAISETGLRDVFKNDFSIGTAIPTQVLANQDTARLKLIAREFSAITTENAMKWEEIRPHLSRWNWTLADRFVGFGIKHQMQIVGHALVWHNQIPNDVFLDKRGKPLNRKALLTRMEDHISTMLDRYKGLITIWDVVNEAFEGGKWRESQWFKVIGEDYLEHAFRYAHAADPAAQLIYNDYGMDNPHKQEIAIRIIDACRKRGGHIHGVGMQSHVHLEGPSLKKMERAIIAFAKAGLRVHITELDVDVLPQIHDYSSAEVSTNFEYLERLNPYKDGLPTQVQQQLTRRYEDLFKLYIKHRDSIDRISFWGTSDDESWKNNWPINGRTNYPLLFDRNQQPKPAYHAVRRLRHQ